MFCPYCGERLSEGDNFCTRCGKRLPQRVSPAVPAAQAQPAAVPAPRRPAGMAPSRGGGARPARSWGSPLAAALCAAASALAVACVAMALFAPLVETPFFAGTSTARGDAVQAALEVVDPRLSVVAGGLIGSQGLGAYDLARLGVQLADVRSDDLVALATGLSVGAAAVAAALCAAGAATTLALRRSTPVLIVGTLLAALLGGAGIGAASGLNRSLADWLIHDMSQPFREMGVSIIPSDVAVVVATPWLVATVVCAAIAFVCAVWARRRLARGRRRPR